MKELSEYDQLKIVQEDPWALKKIENPTEMVMSVAVKQDGVLIKYIETPSYEVQKTAVEADSKAIAYIDSPSDELQLIAIKDNPNLIIDIKEPTERVVLYSKLLFSDESDIPTYMVENYINAPDNEKCQLDLVKLDGNLIKYFKNPSELVMQTAVNSVSEAIQHISNQSNDLKMTAAFAGGTRVLEHIKEPSRDIEFVAELTDLGISEKTIQDILVGKSEEAMIDAIKQSEGSVIYLLELFFGELPNEVKKVAKTAIRSRIRKDPFAILDFEASPLDLVEEAATQDGMIIQHLMDLPFNVKIAAVKQNGFAIQFIANPTEKIQIGAVNQNGLAIQFIENPSEKVQINAIKQTPKAYQFIKTPTNNALKVLWPKAGIK